MLYYQFRSAKIPNSQETYRQKTAVLNLHAGYHTPFPRKEIIHSFDILLQSSLCINIKTQPLLRWRPKI
uniref:Uncharacterized protein n=1 Tax=Zea mays TaxID=4577 RepID=C0HDW1_MAIZE|nr:unknown [Zea mays]